jgi:hypothetical protein
LICGFDPATTSICPLSQKGTRKKREALSGRGLGRGKTQFICMKVNHLEINLSNGNGAFPIIEIIL